MAMLRNVSEREREEDVYASGEKGKRCSEWVESLTVKYGWRLFSGKYELIRSLGNRFSAANYLSLGA